VCLALSAALVEGQTTPVATTDTTAAAPGTHLARPWQCNYVPAGTHCTSQGKAGRECHESGPSCSSPTELKRRQSYGIPLLCAFFLSLILIFLVKADNGAWWRRRVLASEIEAAKKQKEMPGANIDALNQQVAALEAAVRYI